MLLFRIVNAGIVEKEVRSATQKSIAVLPLIDYHWPTYDNRSKVGRLFLSNQDKANSPLLSGKFV
jgi:hypothetical protein